MNVNPAIFREYDIRGIVDKDLTPGVVEALGRGLGTYFRRHNAREVAVGRDVRLSSPSYFVALARGLLSTGCDVVDLGVVPTPLLYFAIFNNRKEAGVMITGSHNPPEYNGFKVMLGEEAVFGPMIQEIGGIVRSGDFVEDRPGRRSTLDVVPEYQAHLLGNLKLERPLKVVVDAGNGTGGVVAVPIFEKLGAEVIPLFCDMDGRFPNHHPDPTLPEAMQHLIRKVAETGAEAGIAFDGDADRIGVVDDRGKILWGDQLMILFARDILSRQPGAAVIAEVKSSKLLFEEVARLGGRPIMWKTGHSLIKKKIKEERAALAGEMSGHIFFADRYFGFDDAIYASGRLLEILSRTRRSLSELLSDLPVTYSTPEIRVYASDEVKFKIVDEVRRALAGRYPVVDIDGVRAELPGGWALVRASNTQAVLVMRFEAETPEALAAIQKEVKAEVEAVIKGLNGGGA
ncbi:MAG: phosphomannomutase [Candidatus Aminicenantes bacterium RBG_13_64_14]|nr:MAG: phosphomannomutase [Candidatus Aminicenantes bacterium RBG_13_64_14]